MFPDAFFDHVRWVVARRFVVTFGFFDARAVMLVFAFDHDRILDEIAIFFNRFFDDVFVGEVRQMVFEVFGTKF